MRGGEDWSLAGVGRRLNVITEEGARRMSRLGEVEAQSTAKEWRETEGIELGLQALPRLPATAPNCSCTAQ